MKDKRNRPSKPLFPLRQLRMCENCGLPFFPSKRHPYFCPGCQRAIERDKRRHDEKYGK
jgi:uncharacterized Zn finger protein (UPF0148 family)